MISNSRNIGTAGFIEKFRYACDRQTNSDLSLKFNALAQAEINTGAPTNLTELRDRITPVRTKFAEIISNEKNRQDFINNSFFVVRQIYRLANWILGLYKSYVPNPTYTELDRVIKIIDPGSGIKVGVSEIGGKTYSVFAKFYKFLNNEFKNISFFSFFLVEEDNQKRLGEMRVSLSEKKCISISSMKSFQKKLEETAKENSPTVLHIMTQVAIEIFYRSTSAKMEITTQPESNHGCIRISEEENIDPKLLLKNAGFDQSALESHSKRLNQSFIFSMSKRPALEGNSQTVFYTKSPDGLERDVLVKKDWRSDWENESREHQRSWESVIAHKPILNGAGPVLPE